MNLVRPILFTGFSTKKYIFLFIHNCTQHTKTYTKTKKNNQLYFFEFFYNQEKTHKNQMAYKKKFLDN